MAAIKKGSPLAFSRAVVSVNLIGHLDATWEAFERD